MPHRIVFSSSSTAYGDPEYLPVDENHPVGNCTSPYGMTKGPYFMTSTMGGVKGAPKVRRHKGCFVESMVKIRKN